MYRPIPRGCSRPFNLTTGLQRKSSSWPANARVAQIDDEVVLLQGFRIEAQLRGDF